MKSLPYCALVKGLFMTVALSILSRDHHHWIGILGLLIIYLHRKFPVNFYLVFGLFWPLMEMFILTFADGDAWVYKHQDIYNVPTYIFPLWAIVSECVVDIFFFLDTTVHLTPQMKLALFHKELHQVLTTFPPKTNHPFVKHLE
jgi:hypothetical protein